MRTLLQLTRQLDRHINRIEILAFFPALTFLAWILGDSMMIMLFAAVLPVMLLLRPTPSLPQSSGNYSSTIEEALQDRLREAKSSGKRTALLIVSLRHIPLGPWGMDLKALIMNEVHRKIRDALRSCDVVLQHGDTDFGIVLDPVDTPDKDLAQLIQNRLQDLLCYPIEIDGHAYKVEADIGFCTASSSPRPDAKTMLSAAKCAIQSAKSHEQSAIIEFTEALKRDQDIQYKLIGDLQKALTNGEIKPWFQPQISADTGEITGFEALARWHHPEYGVLTPALFFPSIAAAGATEQMGAIIRDKSLRALHEWDNLGLKIPTISINLSIEDLRNPVFCDRLNFEVDRFDLNPERICLEIVETITADTSEQTIVENIHALKQAGYRLDLDDFGTGSSSVQHVARFGVTRIKIDRSFITNIDADISQKHMVSAILSMAERLGLETVAEGVETPLERVVLEQMGCTHLQGYAIARPMPAEDTLLWIKALTEQKTEPTYDLRRKLG